MDGLWRGSHEEPLTIAYIMGLLTANYIPRICHVLKRGSLPGSIFDSTHRYRSSRAVSAKSVRGDSGNNLELWAGVLNVLILVSY